MTNTNFTIIPKNINSNIVNTKASTKKYNSALIIKICVGTLVFISVITIYIILRNKKKKMIVNNVQHYNEVFDTPSFEYYRNNLEHTYEEPVLQIPQDLEYELAHNYQVVYDIAESDNV